MRKKCTLKNGTAILIKSLTINDLDTLMDFYRSLPLDDRRYLRVNVTDQETVERRVRSGRSRKATRIIALLKDKIIGEGEVDFAVDDWHRNHGELRVIVAKKYQRKGLGMIMMRELYLIAKNHKVEKLVAKMMRPQMGARKICRRLGFREEMVIPDYVQDQDSKLQDLVIMTCDMQDFWDELELLYGESDWQRCR